jgi:hypothetical protein
MNLKFQPYFTWTIYLLIALIAGGCGPHPSTLTPPAATSTPPVVLPGTATAAAPEEIKGPLFVNPDNRRYFTDGVKVNGKYRSIYLTGAHTWCNLMDCGFTNPPVKFDYEKFLEGMQARQYNFFRLWRAENVRGGEAGPDFWFDPMPYQRSDQCCAFDGGNKFDLEKFNQAYFDRMRERIIEAGNHGFYVSVMLFDGWSVESKFGGHEPWVGHPYKLENNINNINGDVNGNGQGDDTHILTGTPVTVLQDAYVRKVIDTVNDLDNVLYEISNESPGDNPETPAMDGSKDWQYHMIDLVHQYETTKPKQHPVGMTWEWLNGNNDTLYQSPAEWVSLGGNVNLKSYEPPVTTGAPDSKIILADTDHLCGICGTPQWVWKSFTRGENPIFMDFYDNDATGRGMPFEHPEAESIRTQLTYVQSYAAHLGLTVMTPQPDLCTTGYCLVHTGSQDAAYLVYLPSGEELAGILTRLGIDKRPMIYLPGDGKVTVDLSSSPVELLVEWFNPENGSIIDGGTVQGGNLQSFIAPFLGDAVLYIHGMN